MAIPSIAAKKPVAWFGMLLTISAPVLVAIEPALPAVLAEKFPPASVQILVAAFGGIVTVISAEAQKRNAASAAEAAALKTLPATPPAT